MKKFLILFFCLIFISGIVFADGMQELTDSFFGALNDGTAFDSEGNLTPEYQAKVKEYNETQASSVPPHLMAIYGNEKSNIDVTLNNGETVIVGVTTSAGRIIDIKLYGYGDPTMNISTTENDIRDVLVSSDPKVELINKLVGQQIKVDKPGFGLVFIGIGVVGLFLIVLILIGFLSVVRNALKKVS